jgi:hypothetical protein
MGDVDSPDGRHRVRLAWWGLTLAITRSGWLSLFLAAVLVPNPTILILTAIAVLPAWLLVTGSREMTATAAVPSHQA